MSDCHCTCNATSKCASNNTNVLDTDVDSTKKYIWGSPCFVEELRNEDTKSLKNLRRMDLQTFEEFQELQVD